MSSAFGGSNRQCNVKCAGSYHTLHTDAVRDGNVEDEDGVLALVNDDVEALIANTAGNSDAQRDDRVGDKVGSVPTLLAVLLFQLRLHYSSALAFWFLVFEGFVLSF